MREGLGSPGKRGILEKELGDSYTAPAKSVAEKLEKPYRAAKRWQPVILGRTATSTRIA